MACCGKGLRRTLGAESSLLETARKTRVRRKKAQGVGLLLPRTPMPQSLASFPRCEDFMAPRPWLAGRRPARRHPPGKARLPADGARPPRSAEAPAAGRAPRRQPPRSGSLLLPRGHRDQPGLTRTPHGPARRWAGPSPLETTMKALTVRQPFAALIMCGLKPEEFRSRSTAHR